MQENPCLRNLHIQSISADTLRRIRRIRWIVTLEEVLVILFRPNRMLRTGFLTRSSLSRLAYLSLNKT